MIELLLVDDESYVVESLKQTIPWEELGVSGVHLAFSGQQALDVLERQPIDVMVTDIRMPGISGLELIEQAKKKWKQMKCILLTGYSDFEYAKRAIQLHAFDYLLKPVDDDELMESVSKAIAELNEEWQQPVNKQALASGLDLALLRENLLNDLLLGKKFSEKSLTSLIHTYRIPVSPADPVVMLLIKPGEGFPDFDPDSQNLLTFAISDIAQEVLDEHFHQWYGVSPHGYIAGLIQPKLQQWEYEEELRNPLSAFLTVVKNNVNDHLGGTIAILVTGVIHSPDELPPTYQKCLLAFFQGEQREENNLRFLEDSSAAKTDMKWVRSMYKPPSLIQLLETSQWSAAEKKMDEIFDEMSSLPLSHEHTYEVFFSFSNAFVYLAHKQGQYLSDIDHTMIDIVMGNRTFHTIHGLKEWTFSIFSKLKKEIDTGEKKEKRQIIQQVQEFIAEHLSQDVSVKSIAVQVYLHPVYLSKLFKQETGESLGDYIIRMKMEKAADLLKHTHLKSYEITTQLGYQNPQYFSKMFKKVYGMTPQEFRESGIG
ncbi:response regulator [Fictibacillus enclensis]|uniref:response regulator transcription factor n=1 Tax=Fictibacillus enclensis TaxID=1017270 RepID=UPI0025A1CCFE|nr:response regulator [Fictibacillus enclensis]MDM5340290.1 response regulator [Fictibacillus enclensis]